MSNLTELVKQYPEIYDSMWFGFECGDGWYELLSNLSQQLTDYCQQSGIDVPEAKQVKEKFGTLRFYVDYPAGCSDEQYNIINEFIDHAEDASGQICEVCGEPGTTGGKRWISTRCEKHRTPLPEYKP